MQETGFNSWGFAPTTIIWLLTFAAIAALGVTGAYWTWSWFAPRTEPATQAVAPAVVRLNAAYGLFGKVQANLNIAASGGITVKLLGLVAASGNEPGYAVLQLDAKRAVAVRQGGEIEPGTRVVEVNADHVVLDRGGIRETLAWPKQAKAGTTAARPAMK